MSGKRVRHTRRSGLNFILTVVAAVAVVGLLGWWVTRLVTDDDSVLPTAGAGAKPSEDKSASPSASTSSSPSEDPSAGGDNGDDNNNEVRAALGDCVDELGPVEAAVKAARPGVASWHAHFQARTDWLAGRISADQMEAIFTRSKHAGHREAPRFAKAVAAVEEPRPCAGLKGVGASDQRVAHCRAHATAAAAALRTAERAMHEWGGHLEHMAQFAGGGMTSGQAMQMWVAAWRRGPAEVAAYRDGVHALHQAPACSAS